MATTPISTTAGRPERSIIIIGGLVLLLVVAAVVAALTLGARPADSYPPDSAEAAVQNYLRAYQARDADAAYRSFSRRIQAQMTLDQYQKDFQPGAINRDRDARLRIDRVERNGERATIFLAIERFSGSGLGANRYTTTQEIPMVREDGAWKIDERLGWLY